MKKTTKTPRSHLLLPALIFLFVGCGEEEEYFRASYPLAAVEVVRDTIRVHANETAQVGEIVDLRLFGEFAESGYQVAKNSVRSGEWRTNEYGKFGIVSRRNTSGGEPVEILHDLVGVPRLSSPQATLCPQILEFIGPETRTIFVIDGHGEIKVEVTLDKRDITRIMLP